MAKTFLNGLKKYFNPFFTSLSVLQITSFFRERKNTQEIAQLSEELQLRENIADICECLDGNHVLNDSFRMYPIPILLRSVKIALDDITTRLGDLQKDPNIGDKRCADIYTSILLYVNTTFFFNEVINMRFVRAQLLYQRAIRRMNLNDTVNAAVDSNEALNYDSSLIECCLLKARMDMAKQDYCRVIALWGDENRRWYSTRFSYRTAKCQRSITRL